MDLGLAADLSVAAASTAWSATRLKFDRIDGESSGDVQLDHLMGIFASRFDEMLLFISLLNVIYSDTGALFRLQISEPALTTSSALTTK